MQEKSFFQNNQQLVMEHKLTTCIQCIAKHTATKPYGIMCKVNSNQKTLEIVTETADKSGKKA